MTPTDKGWRPEAPPLQGRGLGWGLSHERLGWLQDRARDMRRNPTEPEKRLWRNLSNSQIDGLKFRRQEVIGPYIADFMCPARALIVEVDGDTHDEFKDRLRDDVLAQFGFLVLRVTNAEVMSNMEGVVQAIALAAAGRSSRHNPHPNPSPEGEGLREGDRRADFEAMTVNERLISAGLLEAYESAKREGDLCKIKDVLAKVGLWQDDNGMNWSRNAPNN